MKRLFTLLLLCSCLLVGCSAKAEPISKLHSTAVTSIEQSVMQAVE